MSTMLAREIAELCQNFQIGIFEPVAPQTIADRNIFVGELPQNVNEGMFIMSVQSPPPHEYIDTEYPILDFWVRSPHTDRAYALLELVFNNFNRRYSYNTANWHIYFSQALGTIVDVDRDRENGKLFRLSVQFTCRNLNNIS